MEHKRGNIPSILVNGRIIGTWGLKQDKNKFKITLSLFEKTNKTVSKMIEQQAERLAHFMGGKDPEIILQEQGENENGKKLRHFDILL